MGGISQDTVIHAPQPPVTVPAPKHPFCPWSVPSIPPSLFPLPLSDPSKTPPTSRTFLTYGSCPGDDSNVMSWPVSPPPARDFLEGLSWSQAGLLGPQVPAQSHLRLTLERTPDKALGDSFPVL